MAKFDDEVETAFELITEFGGEFGLRVPNAADASWPPVDEPTDYTITAVLLRETYADAGKSTLYIPAKDVPVTPAPGMLVVKNAAIVGIIAADGVDELNPDGAQPILYLCRLAPWPTQTT
jgi:hypothetical protein